jgi:hypothetical protein
MTMNRVEFTCQFHDRPALGRLSFDADGAFRCAFVLDEGRETWSFNGTWKRVGDDVTLATPHGFAEVTLSYNADSTLSYRSHRGGYITWNLAGARSTPLTEELPRG